MNSKILAIVRNALAELYQDETSIRRIIDDSGIPSSHIALGKSPIDNWHFVLTEARKFDRVDVLLQMVAHEYKSNKKFQDAYITYLRTLEQAGRINIDSPYERNNDQLNSVEIGSSHLDAIRQFGELHVFIDHVTEVTTEIISQMRQNDQTVSWGDIEEGFLVCQNVLRSGTFQLAVLGLSNAGKSTLINAWLGNEFLPQHFDPETAHSVHIRHVPTETQGKLLKGDEEIARGVDDIRSYLKGLNNRIRISGDQFPKEDLILEVPIISLANRQSERQEFEILDTGGPNEWGAKQISEEFSHISEKAAAIVYLVDREQLFSKEQIETLLELLNNRQDLLKGSNGLFIVVNKIDRLNHNRFQDTPNTIVTSLRNRLPDLAIPENRVLLISAQEALVARVFQNENISTHVISNNYSTLKSHLQFWDDYNIYTQKNLKDSLRRMDGILKVDKSVNPSELVKVCSTYVRELFLQSGMQKLEDTILNFVYIRRKSLFLQNCLKDFRKCLNSFDYKLEQCCQMYKAKSDLAKTHLLSISSEFDGLTKEIEQVLKLTTGFKDEFKKTLHLEIQNWQGQAHGLLESACDKGQLSGTKTEADRRAGKLQGEISTALQQQFKEFQQNLESKLDAQQRTLFEQIQSILMQIEQRIDDAKSQKEVEKKLLQALLLGPESIQVDWVYTGSNEVSSSSTSWTELVPQQVPAKGIRGLLGGNDIITTKKRKREVDYYYVNIKNIQNGWRTSIQQNGTKLEKGLVKLIEQEITPLTQQLFTKISSYRNKYESFMTKEIEETNQALKQNELDLADIKKYQTQVMRFVKETDVWGRILISIQNTEK